MNLFSLFRRSHSNRPDARSRPTFRPTLEGLEDRFMPAVDFFGGPVIPHVEVNTLFLGKQWDPSSPNNLNGLQNNLNTYLGALVNSPYVDMLAQYNVGRGSLGPLTAREWLTNDPDMQQMIDDNKTSYSGGLTELQTQIVNAIQKGWLAAPNSDSLYVVFLPPGEKVAGPGGTLNTDAKNGFLGYHDSFSYQSKTIYYAVLPYPGGTNYEVNGVPSVFDSLTTTVSHELSEAVTDPVPGRGWYDKQHNEEIGDLFNQQNVYWDGYVVQKEAGKQGQGLTPALPAAGVTANATVNQLFNGTVMTFTDHSTTVFGDTAAQGLGGAALPGNSFRVTINWGDGQTSTGQVVYNGVGQYSVIGSHSYANTGGYTINVSVTDKWGVTVSTNSKVSVAPSQTVPTTPTTPTPTPPATTPSDEQLYKDGITLVDEFFAGGISAILADAALMHDIETAPGGLYNASLDAGIFAVL